MTSKPLTLREALSKIIAMKEHRTSDIYAIASEALAKEPDYKNWDNLWDNPRPAPAKEDEGKDAIAFHEWVIKNGVFHGNPLRAFNSQQLYAKFKGIPALKEDTGKLTYYGGQISEDEIIGDKLIKEDTGKEDEG